MNESGRKYCEYSTQPDHKCPAAGKGAVSCAKTCCDTGKKMR